MSIPDSIEPFDLQKTERLCHSVFLYVMLYIVESMGPPHGEESGFDIQKEGFDTPWLHTKTGLIEDRFLFEKNT